MFSLPCLVKGGTSYEEGAHVLMKAASAEHILNDKLFST